MKIKPIKFALAFFGFLVVFLTLWKVPQWQVSSRGDADPRPTPKELFGMEDDARKTIGQILGGGALLIGLFFTGRTYLLNYEGQITDRFSKAVEQHGHESMAIRLGGVFALENCQRFSAGSLDYSGSTCCLRSIKFALARRPCGLRMLRASRGYSGGADGGW